MKLAVDSAMPNLTRSEKQAARLLLARYPMIGLESITSFAKAADVSSATIQRFVQKLGCESYPEFRQKLRDEIAMSQENPLTLHRAADEAQPADSFRHSMIAALERTLDAIKPDELTQIVSLLSERKRKIFIVGGTFTYPMATHLHFHLRKMRPNVTLLEPDMPRRSDSILDLRRSDILVVFDIRRYQPDTILTARWAAERQATIVLFTDQWMSEVATFAKHVLRCEVQASTPWDTLVGVTALVELIVSSLDSATWPNLKTRLEALDKLRDETFVPDWHT